MVVVPPAIAVIVVITAVWEVVRVRMVVVIVARIVVGVARRLIRGLVLWIIGVRRICRVVLIAVLVGRINHKSC